MTENNEDKSVLYLDHEYLLYYNGPKSKYGESVAIDVFGPPDDPLGSYHRIAEWYKENNIGKGYPQTRERTLKNSNEVVEPCYFKVSPWTKITDMNDTELTKDELRPGVKIGLVAKAYPYDNMYGQGTTYSLEQIIIYEPKYSNTNYLQQFKRKSAELEKQREEMEKKCDEREKTHQQNEDDGTTVETEQPTTSNQEITSEANDKPKKNAGEEIDYSEVPF